MGRHVVFAASLWIILGNVLHAQRPLPIVEQIEAGMSVTAQGCVQRAEKPGAYIVTNIQTWPIAKSPAGPYGPRHFAIRNAPSLEEFVGDMLQLTGRIESVKKSELETEPGLHRYGSFLEIERPDGNILFRPETAGVPLDRRAKHDDVSVTLLEYRVDNVLRVMRGCLATSDPSGRNSRRR